MFITTQQVAEFFERADAFLFEYIEMRIWETASKGQAIEAREHKKLCEDIELMEEYGTLVSTFLKNLDSLDASEFASKIEGLSKDNELSDLESYKILKRKISNLRERIKKAKNEFLNR